MGFPRTDVEFSRLPVALVLNPNNELKAYQVKPHLSKFFVIKEYGVFEIDSNTACRMGKTPIYFYYSDHPKPLHMKYLSMLYDWSKRNGVNKITRRELRQSDQFDRMEAKQTESIQQEIASINQKLLHENEVRIEKGETPLEIDPHDYAQFVIDSLQKQELITQEEGYKLRFQMLKGDITIDDFMTKLGELHAVQILEPIPLNPRRWLGDEFASYKPGDVYNYIKTTRGLDKRIEKLGVTQVKNLIPAAWIFVVVLAIVLGAAVLVNSGVLNQLASFLGLK